MRINFKFLNMVLVKWRGEWCALGRNQAVKMLLEMSEGTCAQ